MNDKELLALMDNESIDEDQLEACRAYMACFSEDNLSNFEEAYQGEFGDTDDFTQNMANELGAIEENPKWPYTCIDWERASNDLMYDYCDDNGHYFRNI